MANHYLYALRHNQRTAEIACLGMVEGAFQPPASHLGDRNRAASVVPSDLSQNPYQILISEGSYLRLRFAEANLRPIATMPRQKRHKQDWEDGLKRNVNKGGKKSKQTFKADT